MAYLVLVVGRSGSGKSDVLNHVQEVFSDWHLMKTYTSRAPRYDGEGGYVFKEKQYFIDAQDEFVELATFPPHSDPTEEGVDYYGKHRSQFDGKHYITTLEEVGVLTFEKLSEQGKLFDYQLVKIFIDCSEETLYQRTGHDKKRLARDAKRTYLPMESYDYVLDNNGSKEALFVQVDELFKKLI